MVKPLLSIIVPVYNVETYLRRCLDSIIKQSISDFELILINDGSTDNSGNICDEYHLIDSRILVIHQKNGGLSSARNAGLDVARGQFIGFVDSDDWIDSDMYELLYNCIINYHADISVCAIAWCEGEQKSNVCTIEEDLLELTPIQALSFLTYNLKGGISYSACNKLFASNLFDNIRFPLGKIYEDIKVAYLTIEKANKVVFLNKTKYNYFVNMESLSKSKFNKKKYYDKKELITQKFQYLNEKYPKLYKKLYAEYINMHLEFISWITINSVDMNLEFKESCKELKKEFFKAVRCSEIEKNIKIKLSIIKVNKYIYKAIVKLWYGGK